MGRQKIAIDLKTIEDAAADGLTEAEVAARLGISQQTITRRKKDSVDFVEAIKRGKARADAEVSSQLFKKVKRGDLGAIIWYEKTRKKYSDRTETENTTKHEFPQFDQMVSKIYGDDDNGNAATNNATDAN
jgi:transcriptional regulator with XRE-family HTH domain